MHGRHTRVKMRLHHHQTISFNAHAFTDVKDHPRVKKPSMLRPKYRPNEFVELKTTDVNPLLGKVKRRNITTMIPILAPILFAKNKPIGINGNDVIMNVLVNFKLISFFSSDTCIILIIKDVGNKKVRTSKKGYPNESNKGVPISKTPTPNTDCTTDAKRTINTISIGGVITIQN